MPLSARQRGRGVAPAADAVRNRGFRRLLRCLGVLLLALTAAAPAWAEHRAPYIPASADVVLERVPATSDPRVRRFEQLRAQLSREPANQGRALELADAYIDYARSTGDARYLGRALAVIEPWLQRNPVPAPVLLTHATILQSRHLFQDARSELQSVLARDPGNAQAWLTLATVALVQGDYAAANDSCVHLAQVSGNFMGMLCTAQLRSIDGHARQAYALLGFIEDPGPEAPATIKAYIEGLMADTAMHLGKPSEAEAHFKAALQWTPGDNFLLADYADFLLDQNRPRDVIAQVKDYTQSDTSFLRIVMAEAPLHSPRTSADIAQMQARFASMAQRGSRVFQREQAIFELHLLHDTARALELAQENWVVQRSPQDMRIFLEAALAAGKPEAARPVLDLIRRSRLQDPAIGRLVAQASTALDIGGHAATTQTAARP